MRYRDKTKKKNASIRFFLTYQIDVFFHFATVLMLESAHDRCSRWSSKIIGSTFVRVRIRYEKKKIKREEQKKRRERENNNNNNNNLTVSCIFTRPHFDRLSGTNHTFRLETTRFLVLPFGMQEIS